MQKSTVQKSVETQIRSLGREDPLEEGMATHSSIFAWRISWPRKPGGLRSMGWQRVRHDWSDLAHTHRPGGGETVEAERQKGTGCKICRHYEVGFALSPAIEVGVWWGYQTSGGRETADILITWVGPRNYILRGKLSKSVDSWVVPCARRGANFFFFLGFCLYLFNFLFSFI